MPERVSGQTRIVFFGTPPPAAKCLRALVAAGYDVAGVYTRPDRAARRGRSTVPTPVRAAAVELGLPVTTPPSMRNREALDGLAALGADLFVVLAYGRILPAALLRLPRLGAVNVHPSLLPRYRGPSPVVTAILDGQAETGVTVMLLDEGMDTGPVLARTGPVPITDSDTAGALTERLFDLGVDLLLETLPAWLRGELEPEPQDETTATVSRLIEKADGELDFGRPAVELARAVRAYDPWPGAFTRWDGKLLKILAATPGPPAEAAPGTVTFRDGRLLIATGDGTLGVTRLQLEGRRAVAADEFLRGHPALGGASLPG